MFRLILAYYIAVTIIDVSCFGDGSRDYSHLIGILNRSYNNSPICPNDKCSESENVFVIKAETVFGSGPFGYGYQHLLKRSGGCCKLVGLKKYFTIHKLDPNFDRIGVLIIEKSEIEEIPTNLILNIDPTILRIIHSGMKTLGINNFAGAKHLTELNVTHNEIETLEPNIFIYAPNLEVIDMSNNRISEVSEHSFENIAKLRILILSNNLIKTFNFKSTPIALEVFMIGNNSLTYLNESLLDRLYKLKELCMNNNQLNISELSIVGDLDLFDMSNNPTSVYLKSKISNIRNSNLKLLTIDRRAETIDASENQINTIVVDPQSVLIELNLSRNNYTTIKNLTALTSLEKLDLSFNRIEDFNLTSFYKMTQLKELNLENSGLKVIEYGLFSHQRHLVWLDISYNDLKEANFDMLTVSIDHLYIEGNGLTNIDINDITHTLPKLRVLGLSNNKFSCEKLIEIRKILASRSVEMYVDELLMVKFSRNINGIGCVNENSTETMVFNAGTKLLPIHTNRSDHFIDTIQQKIKEIEQNIRQHNDSLTENSINSKDDILSMKQELMDIRNDGDLKIINAKSDILMSVSRLWNVSLDGSNVTVDIKSTIEEINQINLERYQSLSSQLKLVKDKLQELVQSVTDSKSTEVLHLKQNGNADGSSVDLISLKNMMTFMIVAVVCLIVGFFFIVFYKRIYKKKRRYASTNTVNTNVDLSLV